MILSYELAEILILARKAHALSPCPAASLGMESIILQQPLISLQFPLIQFSMLLRSRNRHAISLWTYVLCPVRYYRPYPLKNPLDLGKASHSVSATKRGKPFKLLRACPIDFAHHLQETTLVFSFCVLDLQEVVAGHARHFLFYFSLLSSNSFRSRSNSQNQTWNNRLVPNRERSTLRLYTVTLLI